MQKENRKAHIRKLNKETYMVINTGEIKNYNHLDNRSDSINSLKQTIKKLRYLINNNFTGANNELFVTLTYAENMTDTKRLYTDFNKFIKRLKYAYKDTTTIDYISVIEPQNRGAWHCHVLLRFNYVQGIYIANKELSDLWGHGFITVQALKNVDNIGAYLSAYLINDFDDKKQIKKGARLHLYPVGINIYRASRGIKKPERIRIKYSNIKKYVGDSIPHYTSSITIEKDNFKNLITYHQYNLKRKNI